MGIKLQEITLSNPSRRKFPKKETPNCLLFIVPFVPYVPTPERWGYKVSPGSP